MRVRLIRTSFFVSILSFSLVACDSSPLLSGNSVKQNQLQSAESQNQRNPDPSRSDQEITSEEVIADEPVMIGGSYLACFVDYSIDSSVYPEEDQPQERVPVGCNLYDDQMLEAKSSKQDFRVVDAIVQNGESSEAVTFYQDTPDDRWHWVLHVPQGWSDYELVVEIEISGNLETKIMSIIDHLPLDMVFSSRGLLYDIRLNSMIDNRCLRWDNELGEVDRSGRNSSLIVGECDDLGVQLGSDPRIRSYSFHQVPQGLNIRVGLANPSLFEPRCLTLDKKLSQLYVAYCSADNLDQVFQYEKMGSLLGFLSIQGKKIMFESEVGGKILAVEEGVGNPSKFEFRPIARSE